MPLPKPRKGESHDDWMERCMVDEAMQSEFEDAKQRAAVCNQLWRDKDKKMAKPNRELRYMPFEDWELREEKDGPRLTGYAAVFGQEAELFGMWREKVEKGAYKKSIRESDVRALWNHNTDLVLGRNKANTLKLSEDDHGLKVEIFPPDTQAGRDAVTSIKRGDVSQMSIAFQIVKQEWLYPEDRKELPLRTIKEARLFDVSPVTFPAFEGTSIQARSGLYLPSGELDPLEEARRLVRCAELGMQLTPEQRQIITAAYELYRSYLPEPERLHSNEPERHHSQESEPEQDGHHSAAWQDELLEMERRLDAVRSTL